MMTKNTITTSIISKLLWICFLVPLLWAGSAMAQEPANQDPSLQQEPQQIDSQLDSQQASSGWSTAPYKGSTDLWGKGFDLYLGVGPAIDLRDPAAGYSARIGLDVHSRYVGIGLEVTVNMLWATNGSKRSDHNDTAYRATNSGLLLIGRGYIPTSDHLVLSLGAAIGVGKRYEKIFSDRRWKIDDSSWLARLQIGGLWLFDNNLSLGLDFEFNFGNYFSYKEKYWSDCEYDASLGIVINLNYTLIGEKK